MAKPKQILLKNIPADEIEEMIEAIEKLGATDITKKKNADGTFNLQGTFPD